MIELTEQQKQSIGDFQQVFGSDVGKRVYAEIMGQSCYNDRIMPQGGLGNVSFELGKRDLFMYIMDKVEADPNRKIPSEAERTEKVLG